MQGRVHFVVVGLAVAVVVGHAACSSGSATSDASTTGHGGATGSAGTGGGAGTGGVNVDGGAGGTSGNAGTGGGGGTGGGTGAGGGGGTVPADAGTIPCGDGGTCPASQVCVRSVIGGASYVCPDAGHVTFPPNCDGLLVDMYGCCYGAESSTFSCAARPSGCGATVTCTCASTLCNSASCAELGASEIACFHSGV